MKKELEPWLITTIETEVRLLKLIQKLHDKNLLDLKDIQEVLHDK